MFYTYYDAVKKRLADQIEDIKDIQKYNDQYSGSNLSPCVALIEFPELVPMPYISKLTQRGTITICIHLVSKVISDKDGYVPDDQYQAHDEICDNIITALKEYQLVSDDTNLGRPLQVTGYQEVAKIKGWLVSKIFLQVRE